ncbi:MAG: M67 family metallopeptidase [Thermoproteota archaeon]
MVLKIRKIHIEEIFQHAKKCYPIEACGILVGKTVGNEKIVNRIYHTENVLASSSTYQIDPVQQLKVFEDTEIQGLDVLGFYHSHPLWGAFWSNVDEERGTQWIGYSFLIVSLKDGRINSYIKKEKTVEKEKVIILK